MISCSFQSGTVPQVWISNISISGNGRSGFMGISFIMNDSKYKTLELFPDYISTGPDDVMESQHPCTHRKQSGRLVFNGVPSGSTKYEVLTRDPSNGNPYDEPVTSLTVGSLKQNYTMLVGYMATASHTFFFPNAKPGAYVPHSYGIHGVAFESYYDTITFYAYYVSSGNSYYLVYEITCNRYEFSKDKTGIRLSTSNVSLGYWTAKSPAQLYAACAPRFSYPSGSWSPVSDRRISPTFSETANFPDERVLYDTIRTTLDAVPYPNVDWGELSYRAVSQVQTWGANGIALSKDLLGIKNELSSLIKTMGDIENPKKWASLFLSYKYGLRLTVADLKSLVNSRLAHYNHVGPAKVSSSKSGITKDGCSWVAHYGVYYRQYDDILSQLYYQADSFDVLLTRKNAWDLIPFSFVLDWVIDVGDYLDRLDAVDRLSHYEVVGAIGSVKRTASISASKFGFSRCSGSVDVVYYDRFVTAQAEPPVVRVDTPINGGFDHYIEAAALIVQRITK